MAISCRCSCVVLEGVGGGTNSLLQVYPSVEYDFVPNHLIVDAGDYIHFQWTGISSSRPIMSMPGSMRVPRG